MDFQNQLSELANLGVRVGLNIQRGQELIITAPLEARALVQHITRIAYQRGAKLVTCFYEDLQMSFDRFLYADDDAFDYAPAWVFRGMSQALDKGAARLYVVAPHADLPGGIPSDKIARAQNSLALAAKVETQFITDSRINWTAIPYVTDSWAAKVFPRLPPAAAVRKLWETVFDVTRASCPDPCSAWKEHNGELKSRRISLQARNFASLRLYDGRTDLEVGLADGHRWVGGTVVAANGIEGNCNIPTEEIFTCPHRERTNGSVFFSKPLVLAGTLVEGLWVKFSGGSVDSIMAEKGKDVFEKLISGDEGARRLGEIGLVPNSSPISQSNILFYNALFDENAASHVAFGQSYAACLLTPTSLLELPEQAGANQSSIHIDCMLGTPALSVDGISFSGHVQPVMREGEFVI